MKKFLLLFMFLTLGLSSTAFSREIKIGMNAAPTSLDPHAQAIVANLNLAGHIFEPLVKMNADLKPEPALAVSWKQRDKLTWEFSLRQGVRFHDGSEFTADDVIWSFERIEAVAKSPNSRGGFAHFTKSIASIRKIDASTIEIKTKLPEPVLLPHLALLLIVNKKATSGALPQGLASEEFALGRGMIGTGPFKFVSFQTEQKAQLERFDEYWNGKISNEWQQVSFLYLATDAGRLSAFLSGGVDAMENVPSQSIDRIRSDSRFRLVTNPSHRLVYIGLDQRDDSPFVFDNAGRKLEKNPLKDARVRQALSLALNRNLIHEKIMNRISAPTMNLVPENLFGHHPGLATPAYDPKRAKELLAEAGYPDGFKLVLHGPSDRYVNGQPIMIAIASMWHKVGISVQVNPSLATVFFTDLQKKSFSVVLAGFGASTGEVSGPLRYIFACENQGSGSGFLNSMSYCNPKMDRLLADALLTMEDEKRLPLLLQAVEIVIGDAPIIPLHNQVSVWAMKRDIVFKGRSDESTFAQDFHLQAPPAK